MKKTYLEPYFNELFDLVTNMTDGLIYTKIIRKDYGMNLKRKQTKLLSLLNIIVYEEIQEVLYEDV
ncbi:hypothetical protein B1NLA3E_21995 [Bacillus sp. 1NLA3E]|nr:hypothetical protein B1NLA3E_21995 [Bacillus sp. 1NLA3E]